MTALAPKKGMSAAEIADTVDTILRQATLEEKVGMMSGKGFFKAFAEDDRVWCARPYRAGGGIERFDVPALYFTDGPSGVARGQHRLASPARWRGRDIRSRSGNADRRGDGEGSASADCNLSGAVCFNLLRHPAWGRAQETYGEDPYHLGEMGAALA